MAIQVVRAFLKTGVHGLHLIGKKPSGIHQVKQAWAKDILATLGFALRVEGDLPPPGPCILVGNHISYLDIPVIMASESAATFIAKDDLLKWPIIGAGAKAAGTIFVSRLSGADRSEVRESILRHVNRGEKIAVFPSGTTSLDEHKPWKRGIFEIAKAAKLPVKLFHIRYEPLREAAYVDDDRLLPQMRNLAKIENKKVTFSWLDCFEHISDPAVFAEELRARVSSKG